MKNFLAVVALAAAALMPLAGAASGPSHPTSWNFYTVDSTLGNQTSLTGINNLGKIVGYATYTQTVGGKVNGALRAFTAVPPYSAFYNISYPGAPSSVMAGLSNTNFQVGYFLSPDGTIGYVRDHGKYTSYGAPGTAFLGENHILCGGYNCKPGQQQKTDPLIVGFTTATPGSPQSPFMLDFVTKGLTTFTPPGATSAAASGINGKGEVCGWMTTASGLVESWFYKYGTYYEFAYPGATATTAFALNWQDNIVGDYIDAAGKTHGFIYSYPSNIQRVFQSVDYPNATSTVIRSINDSDKFVGNYVDAGGTMHGFLAVPTQQ